MRKIVFSVSLVLILGINSIYAGEIDILLQKLVQKGVLTDDEARQIADETKEQVKKETAQNASSSVPAWVQNTKFKGDFRLRYQYDHTKRLPATTGATDTNRARIRLRLGLESKINDKLLLGIGVSTGKNDSAAIDKDTARGINQTLGNGFSKHVISFNYAFAQYSPFTWADVLGGKFRNPLWEPCGFIWDTDINPEGAALKLSNKLDSRAETFLNTGFFIIDEGGYAADPAMYVFQPGIKTQITDKASLKAAVSYYGFSGIKGKQLDGTTGTNSNSAGALTKNYKNIAPALELGIKEPLKILKINTPYLGVFAEYVKNIDSSAKDRDTGYVYGFSTGNEKIEKWADWQFRYNYAMLGKDSILDILPDSDYYGGKTGMRAHRGTFDWGLGKNTWLCLFYSYGWQLPGNFGQTQTKPETSVKADWNMKF